MWGRDGGDCAYGGKSAATFLTVWLWIVFGKAILTPPWNIYLLIISHNVGTGGSSQKKGILLKQCELWSNHPNTSLLASSPVDTHWAFTQAKNMSHFLSSILPFILHVRALLGAAGPWPNWGLKPPSCKVVGCQTSSDLQLGAHAMALLLWAIKGKWQRDVQIPLAILTYILSNRVEWLHGLTITTWWKEANLPGPNRELTWRADGSLG